MAARNRHGKITESSLKFQPELGGADRDRTGDPLLAKQVLSQLSYSPSRLSEKVSAAFGLLRHR